MIFKIKIDALYAHNEITKFQVKVVILNNIVFSEIVTLHVGQTINIDNVIEKRVEND